MGRGLRKNTRDNETKEYLVVIDFIGNYKNNYLIPMALSGDSSMNKENLRRILMSGNNLIAGLSYSANGSEVDTVIINGKITMENRRILTMNEQLVYRKIQRIIERMGLDKKKY